MNDMRECPFCGHKEIQCYQYDGEYWTCECMNCKVEGPLGEGWSGAVEMWNLRRPYDKLEERRSTLEYELNEMIKRILGDKENE